MTRASRKGEKKGIYKTTNLLRAARAKWLEQFSFLSHSLLDKPGVEREKVASADSAGVARLYFFRKGGDADR